MSLQYQKSPFDIFMNSASALSDVYPPDQPHERMGKTELRTYEVQPS